MRLGIVGGGVFGAATAWEAAKRGYSVDLFERDTIPGLRAASNDISKATRLEYGDLTLRYAPLVHRAFGLWREAEVMTGQSFFHNTGVVALARLFTEGGFEYESWKHLKNLGFDSEVLDPSEGQRRFPQFNWERLEAGTYNKLGGWLRADLATKALVDCAALSGATILEQSLVQSIDDGCLTVDGKRLSYDKVLVCAGAWVGELVPSLLKSARVSRQLITYYKPKGEFPVPVWIHDPERSGWYGFPLNADGIVKVALHQRSETVDPNDSREIDDEALSLSKSFVQDILPGLDAESQAGGTCCFYTNSPSGDPVIQRLTNNLLVAGFGSGHAFKFGPVLGELALEELESGAGDFALTESTGGETW